MFRKFYPHHYVRTIYDINFVKLYTEGYRGLIFDIDNTLVEHGADATVQVISFMDMLKTMGYSICFLSNNKEGRVKRFNQEINQHYIYKAGKPSKKGYQKAMELLQTTTENTIFVGDQLFTDVYGANRCKIKSYLVHPIDKKEEIQIVFKRFFERIVLSFDKRRR